MKIKMGIKEKKNKEGTCFADLVVGTSSKFEEAKQMV